MSAPLLHASTAAPRPAQDVNTKLLYAAYGGLRLSLIMTVVVTLIFIPLLWPFFPPVLLTAWLVAILTIVAARFVLSAAFQRAAPTPGALALWRNLFIAGSAAAGAAWSFGPILLIPHAHGAALALLVGTLLSVSAVAMTTLTSQQLAMHAFVVVALTPVAAVVWRTGGDVERAVALVIMAGLVSVILVGRRSGQAMRAQLEAESHLRAAVGNTLAAQASLEESEERYRTLVEWSPEPITVLRSGKIIYVNPAAIKMVGAIAAKDLIGEPFLDRVHPDFHQIVLTRIKRIAEDGVNSPMIGLKYIKVDGTAIDVEVQSTPIVYDGSPAIHVAIRDVTERKQAEAAQLVLASQLRESQKMEALGTLAGGIAHDFNNILAAIMGNIELARDDARANPRALESLEEIRKAGARARDLVQQILSFGRRQPIKLKVISLAPVVDESVRLLRTTLPSRVALEAYCEPDMPAVQADANHIQQVLINLVTNAMQSMAGGAGCIGIRLDTVVLDSALAASHPALVALHSRRPGRTLRLAVSDNGPGIDAAVIERIFEPFFTTKAVDEGTGLGLSVVHGIVQTHEGAIVVESQPDQATTFTIYLPVAAAQSDMVESDQHDLAIATPPSIGGCRHILYLDDDESLLYLITRAMARRSIRISGYTKQRDALDAIQASPAAFDLVVTDYNMPGMSGLDVAREVRAIRADLPVVVASGFIDENLREKAAGAGVRELIFKAGAVEALGEAFARLATKYCE